MVPSGNNYVVLRMDRASISQQCLLTAGSTVSFYLRYKSGFKSTGCTITFEVTISYSRVLTIQLPSSATAWTLYSVIVPGSYGSSQSLQFEVTVPDGSDTSAEIDNVVIAPPSSVPVTSLSYRHSFNGGTASDSVMFPSASGGWLDGYHWTFSCDLLGSAAATWWSWLVSAASCRSAGQPSSRRSKHRDMGHDSQQPKQNRRSRNFPAWVAYIRICWFADADLGIVFFHRKAEVHIGR